MSNARDALLEACIDYYQRHQQELDAHDFLARSEEAVRRFDELTRPPQTQGRLTLSLLDLYGYQRCATIVAAIAEPFGGAPYEARYLDFFSATEDFKEHGRERREYSKSLSNLDPEWVMLMLAFNGTPLYPYMERILTAFTEQSVPHTFPDHLRFRGQWIVGNHGTGKTTYLSNIILDDLDRAARGECSVVVMDSQNELVPQLARLARFAEGGDLEGKLIYIEPDPEHPLALNILDTGATEGMSTRDRETLNRGSLQLINFFLASVTENTTTPHMDTILNHLVPAALSIPDATIFTLQALLEDGYEAWKTQLAIDPEEHTWLSTRLNAPEYKPTLGALKARLDGFTADPMFRRMFRSPRNRLDLFQEFQAGKVVLINTNKGLLKDATPDFGRFFIAKILQATEQRMLMSREDRLPVFVHIDEAADYIRYERNIEELIDKARKQRVALTLAAQSEAQISSATVLAALKRTAIQVHLQTPGHAPVNEDGKELGLAVPNVDLTRLPTMSNVQWHRLLDDMHERYSVVDEPEPQAAPPLAVEEQIVPLKDW